MTIINYDCYNYTNSFIRMTLQSIFFYQDIFEISLRFPIYFYLF
jgi:hypothetical protein